MASPYDYPRAASEKPPKFTIMTVIAVAFGLFMVWQVAATIDDSEARLDQETLQEGDRIEYHFVARLPDGTLWDTSRLDVAEAANQTEGYTLGPAFNYQPQTARVSTEDPGLGWGPDADAAVIGAHAGRTIRFQVDPTNGTGDWEPFTPGQPGIPRVLMPQGFQRVVFLQEPAAAAAEGNRGSATFDMAQLNASIGPIHEGFVFNSGRAFPPSWDLEFIDVNWDNRSITFRQNVQDGQYFDTPGLPGGVTVLLQDNESRVAYRLDLEEGGLFVVQPQGELNTAGFSTGSYRVADVNDEFVELLYHPSMRPDAVGQPLTVELTILGKVEGEGGTGSAAATSGGAASDGHTDHTH